MFEHNEPCEGFEDLMAGEPEISLDDPAPGDVIPGQFYLLTIKPAIEPLARHDIEDALKALGYICTGGGTQADGSSCDISFFKEKKGDK